MAGMTGTGPPRGPHPGLCESCRHARVVEGANSRFWLCQLSASDPRFPRYPRLPVVRCAGYELKSPTGVVPPLPERGKAGGGPPPTPPPPEAGGKR